MLVSELKRTGHAMFEIEQKLVLLRGLLSDFGA